METCSLLCMSSFTDATFAHWMQSSVTFINIWIYCIFIAPPVSSCLLPLPRGMVQSTLQWEPHSLRLGPEGLVHTWSAEVRHGALWLLRPLTFMIPCNNGFLLKEPRSRPQPHQNKPAPSPLSLQTPRHPLPLIIHRSPLGATPAKTA